MIIALLPALLIGGLPFFLWNMSSKFPLHVTPELFNSDIGLVIAHPDDEVMFFGPSLYLLAHKTSHNNISILCFSKGNADGIGHIRSQEYVDTITTFFPIKSSNLMIIDDESRFKDSMKVTWNSTEIANEIDQRMPNIQKIVTFDDYGISGHPNHISLYYGALEWQKRDKLARHVYILKSVPIWRKYIGNIDTALSYNFDKRSSAFILVRKKVYHHIRRAMIHGYASQVTWFRKIWVIISRYMVINVLEKIDS